MTRYLGGAFPIGPANGDQRAYGEGYDRIFGKKRQPRQRAGNLCDRCGRTLGRLEVGIHAVCPDSDPVPPEAA